jgi:hypothetical protein
VHVDVAALGAVALHRLELARRAPARRELRRKQHIPGALVIRIEAMIGGLLANHRRPHRQLQDARVGLDRDVGVDQRRAAEAATDDDVEVAADVAVEQPEPVAAAEPVLLDLHVAQDLVVRRRELPGGEFAAALEHAHARPRLGEPRRAHAGAVARADHDDVHHLLTLDHRVEDLALVCQPHAPSIRVRDAAPIVTRMRTPPQCARRDGRGGASVQVSCTTRPVSNSTFHVPSGWRRQIVT